MHSRAEILVAVHGAGMTKEMFMPTGGLIIELSSHFNDVQMPVCGYYANIASMFGHHHYLYAYRADDVNKPNLDGADLVMQVKNYYDYVHSDKRPLHTFEWQHL